MPFKYRTRNGQNVKIEDQYKISGQGFVSPMKVPALDKFCSGPKSLLICEDANEPIKKSELATPPKPKAPSTETQAATVKMTADLSDATPPVDKSAAPVEAPVAPAAPAAEVQPHTAQAHEVAAPKTGRGSRTKKAEAPVAPATEAKA
jgi:hypothetical protein